ncbi:hypothetical protein O181_005667, partial [Austropuccinia psidii MF-1]|nr:hypothetical protein [Austropuccinia psidii MF-1]
MSFNQLINIKFHSLKRILLSRTSISVIKGAVAYVAFFVLFLLKPFQDLLPYPSVGTSAVLICIAGFPGASVGACLESITMASLGIATGAINFVILAKLTSYPVPQGLIFFLMLYIFALIKTVQPKYLIFSLFCILMTWNGFYTPFLLSHRNFSADYLMSYLEAYAWGIAIVVCVNVFLFPCSAETELRSTLVNSLDHIRTAVPLISKTYWCEIDQEEIQVRDALIQSIRADFNLMQTKLAQSVMGVNYSRWSLADYKHIVQLIKSMQQSLITIYSSLRNIDKVDAKTFKRHFGLDGKDLRLLRMYTYVGLAEVQRVLATGAATTAFVKKESELLKDIDLELGPGDSQSSLPRLTPRGTEASVRQAQANSEAELRLRNVENNLAFELSEAMQNGEIHLESSHFDEITPAVTNVESTKLAKVRGRKLTKKLKTSKFPDSAFCTRINNLTQKHWKNYQNLLYDRVGEIFSCGKLYHPQEPMLLEELRDPLDFELARISANSNFKEHTTSERSKKLQRRRLLPLEPIVDQPVEENKISSINFSFKDAQDEKSESSSVPTLSESIKKVVLHRSLMRVYSHSFSMDMFLQDLINLRKFVLDEQPAGGIRKKRIHLHFLEDLICFLKSLQKHGRKSNSLHTTEPDTNLTIREALATLEKRDYHPVKVNWLQRFLRIEKFLRSSESCCAFKVSCGVIVLAIMFRSSITRNFALEYSLNSAIITITVAITPTLGQSWISFLFQVSGQGLGLIYSMIVLEIFHNVGGYKYNPYGLVSSLGLFSIPLCYIIYTNPQLFVLALLAMNSAASLVYSEFLNQRRSFDSPPYRMGKSLATLAIAIGLVSFLQLFVLRNPGRRTLRKAVAKVMEANTAYTVILQSYVRATIPTSPTHRSSLSAIRRVQKDLIKREMQIQNDITALVPLIKFARAEPSFVQPFNMAEYVKIANANQLILDRNRDARIAIGTNPLPEVILKEFVEKLAPYRAQLLPKIKTSLYLCTSTLHSKFPLPEKLNSTTEEMKYATEIFHDALVLSSRLADSPEGLKLVKSPELTRYWLYLLSMTSVSYQLESIQESAKKLFGTLEDQPLNTY